MVEKLRRKVLDNWVVVRWTPRQEAIVGCLQRLRKKRMSFAEYAGIAGRRRNLGWMDQAQWVNGLEGRLLVLKFKLGIRIYISVVST